MSFRKGLFGRFGLGPAAENPAEPVAADSAAEGVARIFEDASAPAPTSAFNIAVFTALVYLARRIDAAKA